MESGDETLENGAADLGESAPPCLPRGWESESEGDWALEKGRERVNTEGLSVSESACG